MACNDWKHQIHNAGANYIELSKRTKDLADRFRNKKSDNWLGWDLDALYALYSGFSERFVAIGNTLAEL